MYDTIVYVCDIVVDTDVGVVIMNAVVDVVVVTYARCAVIVTDCVASGNAIVQLYVYVAIIGVCVASGVL